jgi:flavin reductase (DIM6/NTAB) family NADH-FMN oxidoreductase RutF
MMEFVPPLVGGVISDQNYTFEVLRATGECVLNVPTVELAKKVVACGNASGRNTDKFAATKLTPVKSKLVDAPYVKEFLLVMECKLVHVAELGLHTQFVGEVIDAKADESIIGDGGAIDIKKLKPMVFTPDTQEYYGIGKHVGKVFSAGKGI